MSEKPLTPSPKFTPGAPICVDGVCEHVNHDGTIVVKFAGPTGMWAASFRARDVHEAEEWTTNDDLQAHEVERAGQRMGQPLPSPYWEQKAKHYASALERIAMTKGLPIEVYEVAADALCWARKHRTEHLDDSIGELADGLTNTTSQLLLGEARSSLTRLRRYALTESDKMDVDYLSLALDHLEEHMGTRIPKDYEPAAIDYLDRLGVDPATGLKPLMRLIADVACGVGVKK